MALDVKVGTFNKDTGTAPDSQAVTGVGFEPVALILWVTGKTSTGFAVNYQSSFGFTDGTNDFAAAGISEDTSAVIDAA